MTHYAWSGQQAGDNPYRHLPIRKVRRLLRKYTNLLNYVLEYQLDEQRIIEVTFQIEKLNEELDSRKSQPNIHDEIAQLSGY